MITGCLAGLTMPACLHADNDGSSRPRRLLIDEYHQFPRSDRFSLGFSLNPDDEKLTYHYATDATALVNGLFMLEHAIKPDFTTQVSKDPIGPNLGQQTDAYVIVCPLKEQEGGPPTLTSADADHLEKFVAEGGMLMLVHNSVEDADQDSFDFKGMNMVAGRFGLEFLATVTRSLMVPIARDHPVFFGAGGIIYGNGTTIQTHAQPDTHHDILLESNNPKVPGTIAVRTRFKRGTVVVLGDAGTLGNAHMVRDDVGHAKGVAQLFHCLLPDGPVPAYGWKEGLKMNVRLRHQTAISGYVKRLRLFDLPLDPAAGIVYSGERELDLLSARKDEEEKGQDQDQDKEPAAQEDPDPEAHRYAYARASWDTACRLEIGPNDGRAFSARWTEAGGSQIECRLTPRGEFLDASMSKGELTNWRWALVHEAVVNPLDPAAQIGDEWDSPVMTPLPHAQLSPAPRLRPGTGRFRFDGREKCRGRSCYVISKTVYLPLDDLHLQDLVDPEYADYFDEAQVRLREADQTSVTKTWVDEATNLPVRTELQTSTSFWWTDRRVEDSFISDHDYRIFEDRKEQLRVAIIARSLVADFD